jgi:hypothetical protein
MHAPQYTLGLLNGLNSSLLKQFSFWWNCTILTGITLSNLYASNVGVNKRKTMCRPTSHMHHTTRVYLMKFGDKNTL